jgi:hypothetical protein
MDILEAIIELENFYGKKLTDFVYLLYKERLETLDPERLKRAISNTISAYPCKGNFFPSVDMILELVISSPTENSKAYEVFRGLPSEAMRMTPDECLANRMRLAELIKGVGKTIGGNHVRN